ncbi:uncharacterized protein LOC100841770 isoform X2 [Brachypodium distachyon]|uniref:DCD domain-containing protein n=2 Tax=Brachypodium distachyon TaxID=15368 RepID=A0A0Q3IZI2_BRADI|nr:uncharacterized protein LOC100841770 isoform X2 [Brachypodium distachyon]XP_014757580.1 uncharacterized protein LOC100841770 isoform X2 [Brachypodium distachyon]KQJ91511.1 hypothetical protein BRADI_4g38130v3 [Brachypodium distachyon]KQJ91512.1 hypothetical protein BRADI_4g38130v3 [Brachypodium distachyon]|eukprot:XP_010238511.1 uncharacterized protein LOC100841770 isoform X2 [Brachypodium distachyon]
MRPELPRCSFRQGANMAGAIFMSNSETREQCFRTNVFGLPPEYEPFVTDVKQGMPLFLFDYTERKLYGVFEATSDGGMNINRAAFRSNGRTYPAQVCFNIVWKCRPLREDEFFPAIEENYYFSKKFYFDLSYQQVVQLYGLFEKKRVEYPICNYSIGANLEKKHCSGGRPDKRSLTSNISPFSADQLHTLTAPSTLKNSTDETNYSASTSKNPIVPPSFETEPNMSMPLATKHSGFQSHSHHDQMKLPYHSSEYLRDVSTVDGIATQVSAPCSQTTRYHQDHFVANRSYPLSCDYPHNNLSSGCMTQGPTDGVRLSTEQSCVGSSLLSARYRTQVPTGEDRSYLISTPYVPSHPHLSMANSQGNANWKDDFDIHCNQCKEIYASEHQHLIRAKSLTPPKLIQQGIPSYLEVPGASSISQQKESSTEYTQIPDCAEDFENEQLKHGFTRDASGSPGFGNDIGQYMSDLPYESTTTVSGQRPQKSVFSRLSLKPQLPSQEVTGPSLNQLLYSLSQRTKQWSSKDRAPTEDVGQKWVNEQVIDRPYPPAELNLPSGLEGQEESTHLPLLNFKRRSETEKLNKNLGNDITGKVKRRKLVRPSFGKDDDTVSSGKELQGNGVGETKPIPVETGGNKLIIDLNEPASVDTDAGEDGEILTCPTVVKIHTEKPCEVNMNEPNCSKSTDVITQQDPSDNGAPTEMSVDLTDVITQQDPSDNGVPTEKISLDLSVTDLNTMDKSKLQAILGSSLLRALDKLRSGKNGMVKMEMNSDGSTEPSCN